MAFLSANPLTAPSLSSNPLSTATPLPLNDGGALARLGGSACPCSLGGLNPMAGGQGQMQQMIQLQLQLMTMLLSLMSGSPGVTGVGSQLASSPLGSMLSGGSAGGSSGGNTGSFGTTPAQPGGKSSFNIASFNVLGSSHTAGGGNKPGMRSGEERMRGAVEALKSHNVDIAGMQEFQGDQQASFKKLAPGYGMAGEKDNAIVWNKEKFRLVERRSVTIPYFEGHKRQMPLVQLEDKSTSKRLWVVNVHNPADTKDHPHNAANRAKAVNIEQALARELQATGIPVMFTGDFNERNTVDNQMDQVGLNSAAPNGARSSIDYVFGSGVKFSNYSNDRSTVTSGTSDHPIITTTATI